MPVDRAAFLSFEVQPQDEQFAITRFLVVSGVIVLVGIIAVIFLALRMRKKRN
jgi:hypothetical protein